MTKKTHAPSFRAGLKTTNTFSNMEIASSYKVKLQNIPKQVYSTLTVYRKAVSYVISLIKMEWINITSISKQLQQKSFIENLIHTTKTNQAKYDFDIQFPNFPSYLRRAVIAQALGAYSAYISSLENYNSLSQEEQSKIKPPALQLDRNLTPTFYKDNMGDYEDIFNPNLKSNTIRLKLYNGKTWNWYNIQCKQKDLNYLHKHWTGIKANCPTILKKNKKFYLVFSFTEKVNLKKTPLQDQKILSIDLGINTDATCSILKSDGTVIDRRFINLPVEKGCYLEMLKTINSVKSEYSQLYGEKEGNDRVRKLWRFFNNKTKNHDIKLVKEIIDFAKLHNVDVIVYEHLDFKGSKGNQKLSHWRKNAIQKRIEHQAHRLGIRISTVNARNKVN